MRTDAQEITAYLKKKKQITERMNRIALSITLVFFDLLIILASIELSSFFRFGAGIFFEITQISSTPSFYLVGSIIVSTYLFEGLYQFKTYTFWGELRRIIKSSFFSLIIIIVVSFSIKIYFSRFIIISSISFFLLFDSIFRYYYRRTLSRVGVLKTNVLIIGAGKTGKIFLDKIRSHPFTTYNPIGFLDDKSELKNSYVNKLKVLGKISEIDDILSKKHVDEIVIALPSIDSKRLSDLIVKLEGKSRIIKFIPNIYEITTFSTEIQDVDGFLSISTKQNALNPTNRFLKRMFDIAVGLIGFAFFIPLYIVVGIIIKVEDGGPILFKHTRIGKDLKLFKMYKFRTMIPNAESKLKEMLEKDEKLREEFLKNFKLKDDPRITKIGKFLRKTSLDEFPQFINVLKGDMSIVGPRPIVQKEVDMYYGKDVAKRVFSSKPGITGMWQASGRSDIEDYDERIAMDIYYVRNQSLWLDFIIFLKTIRAVLKKDGAY